MTRILCHLSVAVLSVASACAELTLETLRKRQEQMRTTIRNAMPSVVGIEFPNAGDGSGSGVIVSADGLILTAAHVSGESDRDVTVIMLGGERLPGKTLGAYRYLDTGMIQVEVNNRSFPHVPLGGEGGEAASVHVHAQLRAHPATQDLSRRARRAGP